MHDCKREQERDNCEIKTTEKGARDGQKENSDGKAYGQQSGAKIREETDGEGGMEGGREKWKERGWKNRDIFGWVRVV